MKLVSYAKNLNLGVHAIREFNFNRNCHNDHAVVSSTASYRHPPFKSAEQSATVFRKTIRLTVTELLADPLFVRLARAAAESDRTFTRDLCEWENRETVIEAVAVVRKIVDAERAEAVRIAAEAEAKIQAVADLEAPVRDNLTCAYEQCNFRTCTQGHSLNVVVGGKPGVSSDTVRAGRYKGSFSGYSKRESVHTITVGADWYTAVWSINLETHKGLLVLATNYEGVTEDGRTMFRILTVRQGAGTALVTEWLAVIGSSSTEWLTAPKTLPVIHAMPPEIAADYIQDHGDEPTAVALRTRAGY